MGEYLGCVVLWHRYDWVEMACRKNGSVSTVRLVQFRWVSFGLVSLMWLGGCGVAARKGVIRHPMGFDDVTCDRLRDTAVEQGLEFSNVMRAMHGTRACGVVRQSDGGEIRLRLAAPSHLAGGTRTWGEVMVEVRGAAEQPATALDESMSAAGKLVLQAVEPEEPRAPYGALLRSAVDDMQHVSPIEKPPTPKAPPAATAASQAEEVTAGGGGEAESTGATKPPQPTQAAAPQTREELRWYGGLILPAYLLSPVVAVAINYQIRQRSGDVLDWASPWGAIGFTLPAWVHVFHGNYGRSLISAAGLVGGVYAGSKIGGSMVGSCTTPYCEAGGIAIGAVAGYGTWALIDMILLPYYSVEIEIFASGAPATSNPVSLIFVPRAGGGSLALGAQF